MKWSELTPAAATFGREPQSWAFTVKMVLHPDHV
jgi:hypothetical protein